MILLHYNLFYMFYTYGLHPNFVFSKYGRDSCRPLSYVRGYQMHKCRPSVAESFHLTPPSVESPESSRERKTRWTPSDAEPRTLDPSSDAYMSSSDSPAPSREVEIHRLSLAPVSDAVFCLTEQLLPSNTSQISIESVLDIEQCPTWTVRC
jgi:hypothetical protein